MELVECQTCGSHSITNGKCDYCGNQYEVNEDKIFYGNPTEDDSSLEEDITKQKEITFEHGNKRGDKVLTVMLYLLFFIVWFAVTVFIPPLFIITIILLAVYGSYCLINKNK